jgi:hypothetical protein
MRPYPVEDKAEFKDGDFPIGLIRKATEAIYIS